MHILLVEDNELNRDMLVRRLARRGFVVTCACDGVEAVKRAGECQPDLVLMDIGLPVLDGWQAIQRLKASSVTEHIPIVALTAHALIEDHDRAIALGCADFVSKPIDLERLLQVIRRHDPAGAR